MHYFLADNLLDLKKVSYISPVYEYMDVPESIEIELGHYFVFIDIVIAGVHKRILLDKFDFHASQYVTDDEYQMKTDQIATKVEQECLEVAQTFIESWISWQYKDIDKGESAIEDDREKIDTMCICAESRNYYQDSRLPLTDKYNLP